MKQKLFTLITMLIIGIGSMWAETKANFVSVVTAIDGSTNLATGTAGATVSTTLNDGTAMSYGLSNGRMWSGNSCSTVWANSDAVSEINSILGKNLAASNYFPTNNANRNGQGGTDRIVTCTANLSNTSNYDVEKYVTFYVALSASSNNSKTLTVSGFSSADYSYALAGGTGFTRVNAINDIPCPSSDYTLVKIRGKLNNSKTATVTFKTGGYSGVQWMAVKYNEETYTVTEESANLSEISNYSSYSSFNVPTGKNLNIDVADYKLDLLNVSGGGTININNAVTKTSSVSSEFTGTVNVNNSSSAITIQGLLGACTIKKTSGTLTYSGANLNGTTLDGVILSGTARINTSNTVNIKNLAGNNLNNTSYNYAFVGSGTINFYGTCDLTKKSDGTDCNSSQVGYPSTASVVINAGANVTTKKIYNNSGNNAAVTNNGTITAEQLYGLVTLGEGSTTTLSHATPFNNGGVTVSGDATLNLTGTTATLNQAITVAEGKTLTIDGGESSAIINLTGSVTNNGTIKFENAAFEGGNARDCLSLTLPYTYENCTLIVTETTDEFNTADETITIINIPSYFTTVKLRRADRRYVTLDVTDGSATFTDSKAKVSGPKCLYDFTFSLETLAERKAENSSWILNSGSRGSSNGLQYDADYSSSNSYNETTGLLKVKSTPWRDMSGGNAWPTNYSVAVYANVPDVENGCLMAFGSSAHGGNKYLALVRGASSNEIKLVKGNGKNSAFELIATMSAENATVAKHLVVFTKSGSTFKVYCDGVNVATTTYSETLGTGFQIGSVHGGVDGTGIIRINDTDNVTAAVRDAAEVQAIRIFDFVLDDDQMSALMAEFPYVSKGGAYSRTILADANLGVDGAWTHGETTAHIPTSVVEDAATYYPDVTITTSADATLTVNEDATFGKTSFGGSGTLTIDTDASGHSINVVGAVIINSDVIVKYGAIDMSTSPVTKGSDATLTFDFSDYDFSGFTQTEITSIAVTGNASDYGDKVTAVYPSSKAFEFSLEYNSTSYIYELILTPKLIAKAEEAIALVTPYFGYIGTGVGKYTVNLGATEYTNQSDLVAAISAWSKIEDCDETSITFNLPTSAFYRIKAGDKYLQDVRKSNEATERTLTDASGANVSDGTIFYLDSNTLIGYKTGYGFGNSVCQTQDTKQLNTQLFTESAEKGKYTIQSQQGTCTSADDNEGYWGVDDTDLSSENDAASGACWTIEEVTSLPVTITSVGWATTCLPVAVAIPEGVTAFRAEIDEENSVINLTSIDDGKIPATEPVVLKGAAGDYDCEITTAGDKGTTDLEGTTATVAVGELPTGYNYYTLRKTKDADTAGFYQKTEGNIQGFRAYLKVSASSGVREFMFNDVTTGIENITGTRINVENCYDLQGRRITTPKKGLFIVNGKKVMF